MDIDATIISAAVKLFAESFSLVSKWKSEKTISPQQAQLFEERITLLKELFSDLHIRLQAQDKRNHELQAKIAELEGWEKQRLQYALCEIASGVFAYKQQGHTDGGQAEHYICANCYTDKRQSILQRGEITTAGTKLFCPKCKTEIVDHGNYQPQHYLTGGNRS